MSQRHVVVDYEELDRMAAVWGEAASTMARLGGVVAALAASPELLANAIFDPLGAARSEAAILVAAGGPGGLAALAVRLAADAVLLKAVVAKEQLVDDLPVHQLMAVERWLVALPVTFATDPRGVFGDGARRAEALADALPGYFSPYAEPLLEVFAPSLRFRLDVAGHRPIGVDPVLGLPVGSLISASERGAGIASISRYSPSWHDQQATSLAALLDRVGDLENQPAASIAIQRVVGADSVVRYVVVLPGMRHFGASPDPQDLVGAAAAVVGRSTAYTRCVRNALDAARVPRGAQVLLVGHSQGGIVAMDLAGDPAFNGDRVRVCQVVAAASPISSKAVAPGSGTRVFSIENVNDVVPQLDAVQSPTRHQSVDRLTYRFTVDDHDVALDHDVGLYSRQLDSLADSPNPLLAGLQADLQPFLVGSVTTTVFTLRDGPAI